MLSGGAFQWFGSSSVLPYMVKLSSRNLRPSKREREREQLFSWLPSSSVGGPNLRLGYSLDSSVNCWCAWVSAFVCTQALLTLSKHFLW